MGVIEFGWGAFGGCVFLEVSSRFVRCVNNTALV